MPVQLFTNNAVSTIAANLGIGVLTIDVAAGEGALFPVLAGGDWFNATIESGANKEIIKVTARATDTLTIERAQEGTSDQSWTLGDTIELRLTNAWLSTVHTEDSLPAASIGDVVGPASSTDSQVAMFDGTTGKLLKDSGLSLSGSNTGDDPATDANITTTDITDNDVSTSKHGFAPKASNVAGEFLDSTGGYSTPGSNQGLHEPFINGSMQIWQREVSFTAPGSTVYHADRWRNDFSNAGVVDVSKITPAASDMYTLLGSVVTSAMRQTVTTADASVAAGDFNMTVQKIEGNRAIPFMHNEFTVSFAVRSSSTGTATLSIRNSGNDRSFLKTFTIDSANTWERKTITVPVQDRTGTWVYDTGVGLNIGITLMSGTTFEGTDDTWNSADNVSVSGATNFLGTISTTFDMTAFQIDLGPTAQAFRNRSFTDDLRDCQRYYYHTFIEGEFPTNFTTSDGDGTVSISAYSATVSETLETTVHPVPMRVAPTVLGYSFDTGSSGVWRNATAAADQTANPLNTTLDKTTWTFTGTVAAGDHLVGHWTAEAEL